MSKFDGGLVLQRFRLQRHVYRRPNRLVVFAAFDEDSNKEVVVKVALGSFAAEQMENERRLLEGALSQVPQVPRVLGSGHAQYQIDGQLQRVQVLVESPLGLQTWSGDDDLMSTAFSVFEILLRVHEAGVVHRDVKPANVIIGPDHLPVLIDFGVACKYDEPKNVVEIPGTLSFVSRAVFNGLQPNLSTDIDSLVLSIQALEMGVDKWERIEHPSGRPAEAGVALALRNRIEECMRNHPPSHRPCPAPASFSSTASSSTTIKLAALTVAVGVLWLCVWGAG
jgi:serine/threonine protein kinase